MKSTYRRSSISPDEVGGAVAAPQISNAAETEADDLAALYDEPPHAPVPSTRLQRLRRRQQAKTIAEGRLTQIGEDLLGLADELRSLNPDLSDSLDDAWNNVEHALEVLLDEESW